MFSQPIALEINTICEPQNTQVVTVGQLTFSVTESPILALFSVSLFRYPLKWDMHW